MFGSRETSRRSHCWNVEIWGLKRINKHAKRDVTPEQTFHFITTIYKLKWDVWVTEVSAAKPVPAQLERTLQLKSPQCFRNQLPLITWQQTRLTGLTSLTVAKQCSLRRRGNVLLQRHTSQTLRSRRAQVISRGFNRERGDSLTDAITLTAFCLHETFSPLKEIQSLVCVCVCVAMTTSPSEPMIQPQYIRVYAGMLEVNLTPFIETFLRPFPYSLRPQRQWFLTLKW